MGGRKANDGGFVRRNRFCLTVANYTRIGKMTIGIP